MPIYIIMKISVEAKFIIIIVTISTCFKSSLLYTQRLDRKLVLVINNQKTQKSLVYFQSSVLKLKALLF